MKESDNLIETRIKRIIRDNHPGHPYREENSQDKLNFHFERLMQEAEDITFKY